MASGRLGAVRYRVGQVRALVAARRSPPPGEPARRVLPPELLALFEQMPPEDRRHGLEALTVLEAAGQTDRLLLQAALLHDVGKAGAGVGLVHRVARTLLAVPAPRLWSWLAGRPTGWRRPFWVVDQHPARGAVWVDARGGDPSLVALIRHHEAPVPAGWADTDLARWHAVLAAADARL